MKTKIVFIIAIILLNANGLCAQTVTDTIVSLAPISTGFEGQYKDPKNNIYYDVAPYEIGRIYPYSDTMAVVSRSYFTFDLSKIASTLNPNITQVTVSFNTFASSYTFKITQPSSISNDVGANWTAIGNGSNLNTGIAYGGQAFNSSSIKTAMQTALSSPSHALTLGAMCENETANDSYSSLTIWLMIVYTHTAKQVTLTAQNDLEGAHGDSIGVGVGVSAIKRASPYTFTASEKQTVNFLAYDNQVFGSYSSVYNDNEAPLNKSRWNKTVLGSEGKYADPQSCSYTAKIDDNNGLFTAYLRKNLAISRSDQTEFDGTQSAGVVGYVVKQNSTTITAPSTKTIGSRTYPFAGWSDGIGGTTRSVTPTDNQTYTALYKITHVSNNASTFSNNSQRKLVRTQDGWYHQVYESMGHVWLEESANGTTWFLGNNGQPLDNGGGKCPSIDWHYNTSAPNDTNYNAFVVVFQQQYNSTYAIAYINFYYYRGSYVHPYTIPSNISPITVPSGPNMGFLYTEPSGGDSYSTTNANPTIAWGGGGGTTYIFALSFERKSAAGGMQPGIYWIYGYMNEVGGLCKPPGASQPFTSNPTLINGPTGSSTNATIALNKRYNDYPFDIIYQLSSGSNSYIYDAPLSCYFDGIRWQPSQSVVSLISSGTSRLNYQPSMVQMPNRYNIRACWIRDVNGDGNTNSPWNLNVVYWNWPTYTIMGFKAQSVSLNLRDDNTKSYFAYSDYSYSSGMINQVSDGTNIYDLSTTGRDIQLSNGTATSSMSVASFYPSSLPYYFQNVSAGSTGLSKETQSGSSVAVQNTYGRGVALNGLGFFYSLKNLTADNSNIRFAEIPERNDTTIRRRGMQYIPLDSLNTMLISKPFTVGEGTSFTFSDDGGFTDSSAVKVILGKKGYISCKLELIDDATGKTLGVMKESKFSLSSSFQGNLSASRLNLKGMGTKNVRVKITVSSNVDSLNGLWVNEYGTLNTNTLAKLSTNEIVLQSPDIVTSYALEQNFPNPFNPTTTINYQLPKASHVTLKVYDMLGRIVATLVNQDQDQGRYTATFDASRLASGVYISRLTAGDVTKTMKMLMIK